MLRLYFLCHLSDVTPACFFVKSDTLSGSQKSLMIYFAKHGSLVLFICIGNSFL